MSALQCACARDLVLMIYKYFLRELLFLADPEKAHGVALTLLRAGENSALLQKLASGIFNYSHPSLESTVCGIQFKNPVGLAAGFDKDCELTCILPRLGFGFVESGTLTPKPQPGNPPPRLFRLKEQHALINRFGFNNRGVEASAEYLKSLPQRPSALGLSIGKNSSTPPDEAPQDYADCVEKLFPYADYFALNVSSPNTPGLRDLQQNLAPILKSVQEKNRALADKYLLSPRPVFVKVSPDLSTEDLDKLAECCINHQLAGLIAVNTTVNRDNVPSTAPSQGGLSGQPLEKRATEMVRHLYRSFGTKLTIMGVGGIFSAEDAYRKILAGASLVQIYTGWIYEGPGMVSCVNRGLVQLLKRDGFKTLSEAVGAESK